MNKISITFIIIIILSLMVGWFFFKHIAPYMIISPQRISENLTPNDFNVKGEKIKLKTQDSIELVGYHIKTENVQKGIIILIHGIGGCKEHMLGLSAKLADKGYESYLFDLRAHGESSGQYCTYGFYEKDDVSEIVSLIRKRSNSQLPIGIWGNSLGGAVAIQALETDKRLSFGIIESTFTSLDQIVIDYQKNIAFGLGNKNLTDYSLEVAGKIANFNPSHVRPIESVKKINQPVLIAHGDQDERISVSYGKALYESLKSEQKELVIVSGGKHIGLFDFGGENYAEKIFSFIDKHSFDSLKNKPIR